MNAALTWIRSWVYLIAFLTWTISASIICLPALLRTTWSLSVARMWLHGIMFLARTVVGVDCKIVGRENIPDGACVVAAQHQSSFETYRLFLELDRPIFVLKRELTHIPFVGWFMRRIGLIGIDRSAGASSMRTMLREAQAALDAGYQIIIFPEGTRTAPGTVKPYRPGVAALYAHCSAPIIPVALNSGYFWGKSRVLKTAGTIVFQFLPPFLKPHLYVNGLCDRDCDLGLKQHRNEDVRRALWAHAFRQALGSHILHLHDGVPSVGVQ